MCALFNDRCRFEELESIREKLIAAGADVNPIEGKNLGASVASVFVPKNFAPLWVVLFLWEQTRMFIRPRKWAKMMFSKLPSRALSLSVYWWIFNLLAKLKIATRVSSQRNLNVLIHFSHQKLLRCHVGRRESRPWQNCVPNSLRHV